MNMIKASVSFLCLLLVVALLTVAGIMFLVDPNQLKPNLANEVRKYTGYDLSFDGPLTWSFYPKVIIQIKKARLNKPHTPEHYAVTLNDVRIALPFTQLWYLNKAGINDIKVGEIAYNNMTAQNMQLNLSRRNRLLSIHMEAEYYGGIVQGIVTANNLKNNPRWSYDLQLRKVLLEPFLQALNNDNSMKISGRADVRLELTALGRDQKEMIRSLSGNGDFIITNGEVKGMDLNYLVDTANALLANESVKAENKSDTAFKNLKGNIDIEQGTLMTKNLLLTTESLVAMGQGDIDLSEQKLNYELQISPNQNGGKWMIPVLISGKLSHPKVHLDMLTLKTMVARHELNEMKIRVSSELKQLPDRAGKFLKKLLGT